MYRNIVYKIDKNDNWSGKVHLFTWDKDGKPITQIYPHQCHLYFEDVHGKDKSIFGSNIRRKEFNNVIERKKFMEQHQDLRYFEVEPPGRELLKDIFGKDNFSPEFGIHPLRIHFLDIEIAVEDQFPEPMQAKFPINVITVYDTYLKKYFVFTDKKVNLPEYTDKEVVLHCGCSERNLLHLFMEWYTKNYPDIISGWNSMFFDIPYLINRLDRVFEDEESKRLSPVGSLYQRARLNQRKKEACYTIDGVSHLDYLLLYRDKFGLGDRKFSYKLDAVAEDELGAGKMSFDGQFKKFYKKDFDRFVQYNIRDVELLVMLDSKKRYIEMARKICNFGLCEYESIYSSIPYIYNAIKIFQCKDAFLGFPANDTTEKVESDEQYKGAFVKEPKSGVYARGVAGIDLNSLYPNTMISLNLSPETMLGKVVDRGDALLLRRERGKETIIDERKYQYLLNEKCTRSANNVLCFKPDIKKGIIPMFLEWLYSERVRVKKQMKKEISRKASLIESGKPEDVMAAKNIDEHLFGMNLEQETYKTFLNSIYGMLGSKFCPLYNVDLAEAITLTGQNITKSASDFIDRYFIETYGATNSVVIYNDTDSVYIDVEMIVNEVIGKDGTLKTKKNISLVCKALDAFTEKVNDYCFNEIVKKVMHSDLNSIAFKRETFSSEGVFLMKKRYILHVKDKEGEHMDKFKVVGYDTKKTEIPIKIRDRLQNIIETSIIENWSYDKYRTEITKFWEEFKTMPIEDISVHKGYTTEKKILGFLTMEKGAGIHAKAATFYNQILEANGLTGKYDIIRVGDRLRYCYLDRKNKYGIDVIGFLDACPDEFKNMFEIDHKTMFRKIVLKPLSTYCTVRGWGSIDPTQEFCGDIMSL